MKVLCSICWEEECKHFKIQRSINKKSFFKKNKNEYEIVCHCNHIQTFEYKDTNYVLNCPKCSFKVLVSKNGQRNQIILKNYFKTPRHKCEDCKTTGILKIPKFVKCLNCHGSGGLICVNCAGIGNVFSNESSYKCDHCNSIGWHQKCQLCMGYRVFVNGENSYVCNKCTDYKL